MMRRTRWLAVTFCVLSIMLVGYGASTVFADTAALEEIAEEIIPVEISLSVNYQEDHRYLAGDPPTVARGSTTISFIRPSVYTFIRLKEGHGMDYMVVPGLPGDPQFAEARAISVYQTHTCHDDQSKVIGRKACDLSGSAAIRAGSGDIRLSAAEDASEKVRISIGAWDVSTDHIPCDTQPFCFDERTFYYEGKVGEDSDAWVETEAGEEYMGIELAVVEWELIASLAEGGELPLVIPLSAVHTEEESGGPPDHETFTRMYTVTGVLSAFEELPLAPLVETDE
ncbi:MAG: hypothetical protein R6V07_15220 [Armatimonadota bacterium]